MHTATPLTPAQRADIHQRARRQAQLLRRATVDYFWHAAYRLAAGALRAAQKALHRVVSHSNNPSGA